MTIAIIRSGTVVTGDGRISLPDTDVVLVCLPAAQIVDGSGLRRENVEFTADAAVKQGAVVLGEIGRGILWAAAVRAIWTSRQPWRSAPGCSSRLGRRPR